MAMRIRCRMREGVRSRYFPEFYEKLHHASMNAGLFKNLLVGFVNKLVP